MNINIEDYVTVKQIEQAVLDEVKSSVKSMFKSDKNIERIISNTAYDMVYKMVDETFNESLEELLESKVKGIITGLTSFNVFKEPNAWDKEPNSPYKFLQSVFEEMKPRVKSRFTTAIEDGVDKESIKMVKSEMHDLFTEWANEKFN